MQYTNIHTIFGANSVRREKSKLRQAEKELEAKATDEEKAKERERRREEAEGAFQSWLSRKRTERRSQRSRSTSRNQVQCDFVKCS
jgi:hypothetical protein